MIKHLAFWLILASLVLLGLVLAPTTTSYQKPPEIAEEPRITLSHRQKAYLYTLAWCESRGDPQALNPDDVGSRSVGLLQFKDETFQHFSEVYNLDYSPDDIWDVEKQKTLAHLMLSDGLESHWENCYNWIGERYPK